MFRKEVSHMEGWIKVLVAILAAAATSIAAEVDND